MRPYLEKKTSQKRAGGVGIGPEYKPQDHTHTHTHTEEHKVYNSKGW
jgi:hypothetical protein